MTELVKNCKNSQHTSIHIAKSLKKADTQTKTCQRVWLSQHRDGQRKKHGHTTMCINHWADSAGFKGVTFNQLCGSLTVSASKCPTLHTPTVTCKVEKKKNKLILRKITKPNLRMSAPKRFCFARPLLPYGAVWETHPHCSTFASPHKPAHNPKAFKRAAILPTHQDIIYYF